ncbi:MAG: PEP-CTERM sorting domain-containing protein [Pirellulales bacterium]|nr:PEP-CTERM sorting domain-containing protein [Pirellulales bacterium]
MATVQSVPEPGTVDLISIVGCGLALVRRRHR